MRLKPNDLPIMEVGEIRFVTFKLGPATGINAIIEDGFTITSPGHTFGTPSISGSDVTVSVTCNQTGTHMMKATAQLASAETLIGVVRAKVIDSTQCEGSGRDYR